MSTKMASSQLMNGIETSTNQDRLRTPKTTTDCIAWNRTNALLCSVSRNTMPVTHPSAYDSAAATLASSPDAVFPLSSTDKHPSGLIVQQDPERVDAERGSEGQHEQVGHGQREHSHP